MAPADRLKKIRGELHKTQKEMAALLGISYRTYENYEKALNAPSWDTIEALVNLGFNANWLLTGEGGMMRELAGTAVVSAQDIARNNYDLMPSKYVPLDEELLTAALEGVEEYLDEMDLELKPAKKAQLIAMIYDLFYEQEDKRVDKATVMRLVKLAA